MVCWDCGYTAFLVGCQGDHAEQLGVLGWVMMQFTCIHLLMSTQAVTYPEVRHLDWPSALREMMCTRYHLAE